MHRITTSDEGILLDEPFAGLDPAPRGDLLYTTRSVVRNPCAVPLPRPSRGEGPASVFVDEPADQIGAFDRAGDGWWCLVGWGEAVGAVGAVGVVVLRVGAEDLFQVPRAVDQEPVEALAADRSDDALGVRVGDRSPHRVRITRTSSLLEVADAAGLTLRMLNPQSDTLETVFLRLTGATDAELSEQRRKQRRGDGA